MNGEASSIVQSRRECAICDENNEIDSILPTRTCSHPPDVCSRCLRQHTNHILRGAQITNLCPTLECTSEFLDEDLQRWADPAIWQAAFVSTLGRDELFVKCVNGACGCGQFHAEGDKEPIVKCYSCGAKQCFIHRVPWHENMTCAEWKRDESRKSNDMSRIRVLKETKKCPRCNIPIHKSDGCDLMACICGFKFCYACRAPYDEIRRSGNHHHRRRCPHYQAKARDSSRVRWYELWKINWWHRARWDR